MPSKRRRGRTKRKLTGSRRQQVVASRQRTSVVGFLRSWWWAIGAVLLVGVGLAVALLGGGRGRAGTPMPDDPSQRVDMYAEPPDMQINASKQYLATIVTAKGEIVVELDSAAAPLTVNNFVFLAKEGFYDGLTFHRVDPGFVIQGGDPAGDGSGGPGYRIDAEIGLPHPKGAIAMARLGDQANPDRKSSGSQFYITLDATPFLDGAYTVFGQVTEGIDVVESIAVGDRIQAITITEQS